MPLVIVKLSAEAVSLVVDGTSAVLTVRVPGGGGGAAEDDEEEELELLEDGEEGGGGG